MEGGRPAPMIQVCGGGGGGTGTLSVSPHFLTTVGLPNSDGVSVKPALRANKKIGEPCTDQIIKYPVFNVCREHVSERPPHAIVRPIYAPQQC